MYDLQTSYNEDDLNTGVTYYNELE